MTIPKGGFKAKYKGEYLGMFDTAQEAQDAIDAARKAERDEEMEWERKERERIGL